MDHPDYVSRHNRQCEKCMRAGPHEVREYVSRGTEETVCKACGYVTKVTM